MNLACLSSMSITLRLLLLFLFFISVVHSTPKNPLIAPKAKEVIPVDIPYTIRWIPQTSGPVYIQLLYDDNVKATNITGLLHEVSHRRI